jgi:hypothetical protein
LSGIEEGRKIRSAIVRPALATCLLCMWPHVAGKHPEFGEWPRDLGRDGGHDAPRPAALTEESPDVHAPQL